MVEDRTIAYRFVNVLLYVFLALLALICVLPYWVVICQSLSSREAVQLNQLGIWPRGFNVENYIYLLEDPRVLKSVVNSLLRVLTGVTLNLFVAVITAYPLSRDRIDLPGRRFYRFYLMGTMLFSGGLIPTYLAYRNLGLIDNFLVLVLPGAMSVWYVVLVGNYFRGLPPELSESAVLDGANDFDILFRIFLPLSRPSLATIALFSVVAHWNSWFDGIMFMNSQEKWPLQTLIYTLVSLRQMTRHLGSLDLETLERFLDVTAPGLAAAMLVFASVPVILVYPFLQRYFVTGLTLGSVKG